MSDKAERLHKLASAMVDVANRQSLSGSPLWQSMEPIAIELGYISYSDLVEQYLDLCASIKDEIAALDLRKEGVRSNLLACVDGMRGVFSASNFQHATHHIFEKHLTSKLATLDIISERLQASDILESTESDLKEALDKIEEAIMEIQESDKIDQRVVRILLHLLEQMRHTYANYEIFGDDKFWKIYKETFSTFVQIHQVIIQSKNANNIRSKITEVAGFLMKKSICGINVASGLATISQLFLSSEAG